jgi:hypothetical protein
MRTAMALSDLPFARKLLILAIWRFVSFIVVSVGL